MKSKTEILEEIGTLNINHYQDFQTNIILKSILEVLIDIRDTQQTKPTRVYPSWEEMKKEIIQQCERSNR